MSYAVDKKEKTLRVTHWRRSGEGNLSRPILAPLGVIVVTSGGWKRGKLGKGGARERERGVGLMEG